MAWLPDGKKISYVYSFWHNVRTWQTDGRTQHDGIGRAWIASRGGKNLSSYKWKAPTSQSKWFMLKKIAQPPNARLGVTWLPRRVEKSDSRRLAAVDKSRQDIRQSLGLLFFIWLTRVSNNGVMQTSTRHFPTAVRLYSAPYKTAQIFL